MKMTYEKWVPAFAGTTVIVIPTKVGIHFDLKKAYENDVRKMGPAFVGATEIIEMLSFPQKRESILN